MASEEEEDFDDSTDQFKKDAKDSSKEKIQKGIRSEARKKPKQAAEEEEEGTKLVNSFSDKAVSLVELLVEKREQQLGER